MIKITIISTVFVTSAFQATGDPLKKYDLSALSEDVAARVAELEKHGGRFDPVIRAIIAEAQKPTWGFDDCGHETVVVATVTPQT